MGLKHSDLWNILYKKWNKAYREIEPCCDDYYNEFVERVLNEIYKEMKNAKKRKFEKGKDDENL